MKKAALEMCIGLCLALLVSCTPPGSAAIAPSPSPSPSPSPGAPAAPLNFAVNGLSYRCVELRWDDNSDNEDNFILQRADDAAFTQNLTEITVAAGAVRYRDYNGVSTGVTRHYRVLAVNADGRSTATTSVAATPPAAPSTPSGSQIADHTVINRIRQGTIPLAAIQAATTSLHIAYGHTSHGSQLISGMNGLVDFANNGHCDGTYAYSGAPGLFSWNHDGAGGTLQMTEDMGDYSSAYGANDLNQPDYTAWDAATRLYLSSHGTINVVMWSWCAGVSHASEAVITEYLTRMNQLENDYPSIRFVYMTGHLDGSGLTGNLHQRNEQIRTFCLAHNKWLLDFADIETYDPDGVDFRDYLPSDGCIYDFDRDGNTEQSGDPAVPEGGDRNWALDWQNSHTQNTAWFDCGAAHSQSINANMKAYAVWWLWCRLAGWNGN